MLGKRLVMHLQDTGVATAQQESLLSSQNLPRIRSINVCSVS